MTMLGGLGGSSRSTSQIARRDAAEDHPDDLMGQRPGHDLVREPFGATRVRRPEWTGLSEEGEVVGVLEISQRLGIGRDVVSRWVTRRWPGTGGAVGCPKLIGIVSGQQAYRWSDVERWARQTGRLPADWDD